MCHFSFQPFILISVEVCKDIYSVPLERATIETLQCSSLLESSQGQICEISCVILRKRGCLRSFGFPGSWWGGAGA